MIKAVLFDLDGTLADTLVDLADAANAVLEEWGRKTHSLEAYRRFVGNGAKVLMERAFGEAPLPEGVLEAFVEEYDRRCLEKTKPYDGVLETLDCLAKAGIKMAVVTNKPHVQAKRLVDHLFASYISVVFGATSDYPRKPDPASAKAAANMLGVSEEECVFVGDSDVDVYTAHAAGMNCIGCCFGFRGENELVKAGADALVYSFAEIQKNRLIFT